MISGPERLSWADRAALAVVLTLLGLLAARQVASLDAGFHLRIGNSILSGHGWPRDDSFTFTVTDHAYVDTSWGYQVVLASIERAFGAPGMVLFGACLVLAIFSLVILTARLVRSDTPTLTLVALLGVIAAEMRYEVRPELLSYTFLALVLYLLQRHAEGRRTPLWLLPLIFLVWANSHSLFILGWAALGCFVCGGWLRERRLDHGLIGWTAASVAATLVNPYGLTGVLFPFTLSTRFAGTNVFAQGIGEFQSPFHLPLSEARPFHPWISVSAFWILFALVVGSLVPLLQKRRYASVLLALPFLYLSARMMRNIPLLVVAGLPGAVWGLPFGRVLPRRAVLAAVVVTATVLGSFVYHDTYYIATRRTDRFGLGWNREILPVAAADYLERAAPPGAGLNHLNFGGYLMWARPEPVFIDGRLEVIGEEFFGYYRRALSSEAALEAAIRRYDIGWIFFPFKTERPLLQALSDDPRWRLVYYDELAAVFVRAERFEPGLLDDSVKALAAPPPPLDLGSLPGLDAPPPSALRHKLSGLIRRERYPSAALGRGLFHYYRRSPRIAAPYFADAVRESGGAYYELYHNLGAALFRLGRDREALECFRIVVDAAPRNETARKRLRELEARLDQR